MEENGGNTEKKEESAFDESVRLADLGFLAKMPPQLLRPNQLEALQKAIMAEEKFIDQKFDESRQLAVESLYLDPLCADGFRVLCMLMNEITEGDTVMCALREIIDFIRPSFLEFIAKINIDTNVYYRQYCRLLYLFGDIAKQSGRIDCATYAFEEILRIHGDDYLLSKYFLLSCYMKTIGRIERGQPSSIVRTVDHLEALLHAKNRDGKPYFNLKEPAKSSHDDIHTLERWAVIFIAFIKKLPEWKAIAKIELKYSVWLLHELISYILFDEADERLEEKCRCNNCMIARLAIYAFVDCPHFIIMMRRMIRKTRIRFNIKTREKAPDIAYDYSPQRKSEILSTAMSLYRKGKTFQDQNETAFRYFSQSKRWFIDNTMPEKRWYTAATDSLPTSRASIAAAMGIWDICRIDTRYALFMNPTNKDNFANIINIAGYYFAPKLQSKFKEIISLITDDTSDQNMEFYAKKCIALLSLRAIYYSRVNLLMENKVTKYMDTGIEDMYALINLPPKDFPLLTWLKPSDLEQAVLY